MMEFCICLYARELWKQILMESRFFSIMFGIGSAFVKSVVDSAGGRIDYYMNNSLVISVLGEEIITWFFGMIMLFLLFRMTGYEKNTVWKEIKAPIIMMMVVIVIYVYFVLSALWIQQRGIESNQLTEGQISNWDYIVAVSLAKYNPWLYVAFFIVFWWLMRRMFHKVG